MCADTQRVQGTRLCDRGNARQKRPTSSVIMTDHTNGEDDALEAQDVRRETAGGRTRRARSRMRSVNLNSRNSKRSIYCTLRSRKRVSVSRNEVETTATGGPKGEHSESTPGAGPRSSGEAKSARRDTSTWLSTSLWRGGRVTGRSTLTITLPRLFI